MSAAATTTGEELRVLLVEDTRADAELCLAELDRGGYRVTAEIVQNEPELRERLHLPFDVVISDYRLPGWTGMDAFHLLQSHGHPEPFLLATGTIGEELAVECLQQGVADFVLKDRLGRLPFAVRRAREAFFSRQQRVRAEEGLRRAQEELELRVKQRTAELAAANAHLKNEIEERARAKRYLESQYLITRVTMERETLEEAAPLILQEICTSFDWQAGGLWRLDAAAGVLRFVDLWKQPGLDVEALAETNRMRSFARGIGLPGGVWEAARPLWIADIMADDKFLRRQCVRSLGLHAALGFPILVRGEVAGIMEFFARDIRQPAAPVMEFVYAVGARVGLFMEHAAGREALRESEQRFRLLAEAVPQIIWTARPDGAIDYCNQRWLDYSGVQSAATKGWEWQQAVHADDLPLVLERWRQALAAGTTFECENRLRDQAGEYLWHLGRAVPMRAPDGAIVKWFGSTTNIHDQKMAQQAQAQLVALRDDLVNNVSHALRTPLASLRGFSELMLAREFPPEKQREFLEIMHKESTRLSDLINNFLDLQRMEAGRQMFHFEPVDLAALLKDRAIFFAGGSAQHCLRLEIPVSLPPVRADGDRIHEVLNNLIANAIKYSPAGGEIVVGAREQGAEILLWVADHGIGIPHDALPHLFQKFYRVENTEGRAISGTGLGLALVRQIVQMHKGRAWAESTYGEGSTFFVALPCERQEQSESAPLSAAPSRDGRAAPPDILIVEDDRSFANLLREHFEGMGFSVGHTRFAEEALALCRDGHPRMLLLDLHLAGAMDGWDLLVTMKHDDALQKVPVVVMMGSDPNVHGLALGGADYVLKSASRESLLQAVRAQLVEPRGKRVLVADDDAVFRTRICHFLRSEEAVVIQASNGREALDKINEEVPDLLVLDLLMPELDGFEVLRRLRNDRRAVNLRTLVVTAKNLGLSEKAYLRRKLASMVGKGEADLDYFCQIVRRTLGVRLPKAQTAPAG